MPLAGFEPTIPVFKRAETFHAFRPRGHCGRLNFFHGYTEFSYNVIYEVLTEVIEPEDGSSTFLEKAETVSCDLRVFYIGISQTILYSV
jgi:hypothetical protein